MKQRRPCKDADREDSRVLFNRGKKEEDLKKKEKEKEKEETR